MKLLISSYACAPDKGSEHGVGWNWTTEAHRLGHEVWALVSPTNRKAIERACSDDPGLKGINWIFPEVALWQPEPGREPRWERSYNLLWQLSAVKSARALPLGGFDLVHHITWGGIRAPTFLGGLGVPLVLGPLGGGETSPRLIRKGLRPRGRITEFLRTVSNETVWLNPILRPGFNAADLIYVRTEQSRQIFPQAAQRKIIKFGELTIQPRQIGKPKLAASTTPRLLFAGRLLYWKGVDIAVDAFHRIVQRAPDARLTIVGQGPEKDRIKAEIDARGLGGNVDLLSWIPQDQLFSLYDSHDLFVFPSLHDSGGTVVVESLSRGLPVCCLDLGGPAEIVTPGSGLIISTVSRKQEQVAAAMAEAILGLFQDPERILGLSRGAIARAREFTISRRVATFYDDVAARLGLQSGDQGMAVTPVEIPFKTLAISPLS